MNMLRRVRILATVAVSGIVVASSACSVDSTFPTPATQPTTPEASSGFKPTAASKALIGVTDGVYTFTVDPKVSNVLTLGPNRVELPANSICNLSASGYGSQTWNRSCTPHTLPITITVTVRDAASATPHMDFQPAMRFNPLTNVLIHFYVPNITAESAKNWAILYCGGKWSTTNWSGNCVDEALRDGSLKTYIDYESSVVFRRIKHFSGYVVSEM